MGIFSRMTDIINSNINSLLDQAEDPEKMIRLIIQEMEDTLVEVRSSSARVLADRKAATRRLEQVQAEADSWEDKARLAISKGREDLARAALQEKRAIMEEVTVVEAELQATDEHIAQLNDEVSISNGVGDLLYLWGTPIEIDLESEPAHRALESLGRIWKRFDLDRDRISVPVPG